MTLACRSFSRGFSNPIILNYFDSIPLLEMIPLHEKHIGDFILRRIRYQKFLASEISFLFFFRLYSVALFVSSTELFLILPFILRFFICQLTRAISLRTAYRQDTNGCFVESHDGEDSPGFFRETHVRTIHHHVSQQNGPKVPDDHREQQRFRQKIGRTCFRYE